MPSITIQTGDGDRHIEFLPGQTLREILDSTTFRVRSGCRGTGACGLCRVQITAGNPVPPNPLERIYLSEEQIASGVRLACQISPDSDIEVSILSREPISSWRSIPRSSRAFPAISSGLPKCSGIPYGMAVDIGTTHISVSCYNLSTGSWFAGRRGLNPQGIYGSDVVARLIAASGSKETARILRRLAIDAIGSAIMDIATREGIGAEQVVKVTLVGNTAMLALISGLNSDLLLQPAYWMRPIDCLPENPAELRLDWGIHAEARIDFLSPLAGFVGSDLLAGVLDVGLVEKAPGTLLIDFGTNSEIALWDGQFLWVTSAAGGPAFEGCGISCGSPAEPGAIYRVGFSGVNGDLEFRTIDDEKPVGLCGSGIVDLIACLLESGKLTSMGRFSPGISDGKLVLPCGGTDSLLLTKKDVDVFQRAKAAIFAAVKVLLSRASMGPKELKRIYIGGAFGHFLDGQSAATVGLLPDLGDEAVELRGNTALRGCEALLMTANPNEIIGAMINRSKLVNLAQCEEFDDFFLEGLYLGRWVDFTRAGAEAL